MNSRNDVLEFAKELTYLLAVLCLIVAVLGILTQGLLQAGEAIPKTPGPWGGWWLVLLAAIWLFVTHVVCRLIGVWRDA